MAWSLKSRSREYVIVGPTVLVGRGDDVDVSLSDASVSRRHAVLTIDEVGPKVEDLGSRNGSTVNGRPVSGAVSLSLGDRVAFGSCELVLGRAVSPVQRSPERVTEPLGRTVPPADSRSRLSALTAREQQVLTMLAQGLPQREIAEAIQISVKTVQTYRTRIGQKLGVRNRAELVRFALDVGLL